MVTLREIIQSGIENNDINRHSYISNNGMSTFLNNMRLTKDGTVRLIDHDGNDSVAFFKCGSIMVDLDSVPNWGMLLKSRKKAKVCTHLAKKRNFKRLYKILTLHNLIIYVVNTGISYKRIKF
ncbi:MAG: hypothetical protein ACRDD8_10535 [Bacteroidales bacterium]